MTLFFLPVFSARIRLTRTFRAKGNKNVLVQSADYYLYEEPREKTRSPDTGYRMKWMRCISSDDRFLKSRNNSVGDFNGAKKYFKKYRNFSQAG